MITKSAARAASAGVLTVTAPASRALANCVSSRSHAVTRWPCLMRCLSMARPMRPTPTMPIRSFLAVAIALLPEFRRRRLRLRLEQLRERLLGIGQLIGGDWQAALDQPPRHGEVALRIDT